VGLWLLVLRRLEFLSDRVLALLAILGPGICIDSWRLVLVEGISGLRQGEQSRAHPGALNLVNVFGVWIKMDLRGGDAAQYWLARGHRLLRPAPSTYVYSSLCHGLLVAEPIMSAFEAILRNPCRRRAPGRTAATHPRDQSCKAGRVVGQACRRKQSSQQLPESQIGQERLGRWRFPRWWYASPLAGGQVRVLFCSPPSPPPTKLECFSSGWESTALKRLCCDQQSRP
jgi:hypothetical protein